MLFFSSFHNFILLSCIHVHGRTYVCIIIIVISRIIIVRISYYLYDYRGPSVYHSLWFIIYPFIYLSGRRTTEKHHPFYLSNPIRLLAGIVFPRAVIRTSTSLSNYLLGWEGRGRRDSSKSLRIHLTVSTLQTVRNSRFKAYKFVTTLTR